MKSLLRCFPDQFFQFFPWFLVGFCWFLLGIPLGSLYRVDLLPGLLQSDAPWRGYGNPWRQKVVGAARLGVSMVMGRMGATLEMIISGGLRWVASMDPSALA